MKDRLAALRAISNVQNIYIIIIYLIKIFYFWVLKLKYSTKIQIPNDQVEVEFSQTPIYLSEFYNQCQDIKTKSESIHSLTDEIKKLHVQILAAPTADESKILEMFVYY